MAKQPWKSTHNKLKKKSRRGDRKKRERQDHSACRATQEGRADQKFVQRDKADVDSVIMLSFEQNSPIEMISMPPCWVVERFHCRVHMEAVKEEEKESERGRDTTENWSIDRKTFSLVTVAVTPLWPLCSAWMYDRKLQRVSSWSPGGLTRTIM